MADIKKILAKLKKQSLIKQYWQLT